MIPIGDSPRSRTTPYVTYALILANIAVFLYEVSLSPAELNRFFFDWAVVPRILTDYLGHPTLAHWTELLRPLTAQFLHGGWLHVVGNMVFLWIFGDNVEDSLGHGRFLLFYLAGGVAAVVVQAYTDAGDLTPVVGASGAISAVLGAYLVLYPRARVRVVIPPLFWPFTVPAVLMLVVWFLMQVYSGVASIGYTTGGEGGVAFWAHIAGFGFGAALGRVAARRAG